MACTLADLVRRFRRCNGDWAALPEKVAIQSMPPRFGGPYRARFPEGDCRSGDQVNRVQELRELAVPPGNRLESLRGERLGQYSIRINDQYRICFRWEAGHADEVEITDYH